MEEFEDNDMECEQINSVDAVPSEVNPHEEDLKGKSLTQVKNISHVDFHQDELRPETPPNNISTYESEFFCTPNNHDSSFIKRVGIEKLMKYRVMPRMTSTPLLDREKHCHTLPSTSAHAVPNLAHLSDIRHCRSAEDVKQPKLGLNGIPYKYINPFTPEGKLLASKLKAQKKFKRLSLTTSPPKFRWNDSSDSDLPAHYQCLKNKEESDKPDSGDDMEPADIPCKARLRDFNISRFNEEFILLQDIGKGDHGCVFKCVNKMNGCVYAVKKTLKPIKTGIQERSVRNEIFAHGVLSHPNIVQNYSCWKEDEFVFMQNEFCNGGNLENYMMANTMSESLLRSLLLQIASGLKYMHSSGLAHMDVKPGNIFLIIEHNKDSSLESDGGFSDEEKDEITFKLGDLGHVTKLDEDDAEEGDCRYLSREIIEETYTHIDRADIFALALTVYEAAGGGPLPKNGDEWHVIRNGQLKYLYAYTSEFNDILKKMVDPTPEKRPSASDLVEMLKPTPPPIPEDLSTCIQQYRRTSTRLEHTALATNQYLKVLAKSHRQMQEQFQKEKGLTPSKDKVLSLGKKKGAVTKTRVVGRKTKRSSSTTMF